MEKKQNKKSELPAATKKRSHANTPTGQEAPTKKTKQQSHGPQTPNMPTLLFPQNAPTFTTEFLYQQISAFLKQREYFNSIQPSSSITSVSRVVSAISEHPINDPIPLKAILKEIATTELLKKLSHSAVGGYSPSMYYIDRTNKEKFVSAITSIIEIDSTELVKKGNLSVSRNVFNKYFNHFNEVMEPIIESSDGANISVDMMITKLFVRVFAIKLVQTIREYGIPLNNTTDFSGEEYLDSIKKIWEYGRTVSTENNSFILTFNPYSGSLIADRFIIDEISNTSKPGKKSNQEAWDDESHLHTSIFPALEKFKKSSSKTFEGKHIKQQINRRSPPTHFRPTSVIDIYNYLVQEKIIDADSAINFFDSSIGWLDRLTAALLCAKGKAFKSYVGFDPNPKVISAGNQLVAYLKPKYNPNFNTQLYQQGIETAELKEIIKKNGGYFSFAFTSPPFFAPSERYGLNGDNENAQVWKLYETKDKYKSQFLKPLLETNFNVLRAGGVFGLHFKEAKLLQETLELVNKDINNDSMKMKVWRQGIYYFKGQKESSELIYLFRRPNRIEEIPSLMLSKENETQHPLAQKGSSDQRNPSPLARISASRNAFFSPSSSAQSRSMITVPLPPEHAPPRY